MNKFLAFVFAAAILGCNNQSNDTAVTDSNSTNAADAMAADRSEVKPSPIASYDYALPNDLNKWHFTVSLKETKKRFDYLLEMQYQEMTGADTIHLPNFGMEPKPQIRKGSNDLECIIGFLDKKDQFREFIKVYIEDDQLRMKTLKQYAVYEK